jgi:hypothetical protein
MATLKPGQNKNPKKTKKKKGVTPHEFHHGKRKKGGYKFNMGGQASFLEPPVEQPFDQSAVDPNAGGEMTTAMRNPGEFTAKKGGMRKLKKSQREERRARNKKLREDRKSDRIAAREFKKQEKKKRKAKPFQDGAGPIVEMSRGEKREDRKATRKAVRTFKKQERQDRRGIRKTNRQEDRQERKDLRAENKAYRKGRKNRINTLAKSKFSKLNQTESSSGKTKPFIGPKDDPNKGKTKTVEKKKEEKKETFAQAYRRNRDAGKKTFMWNGKSYTTESKSEKQKRTAPVKEKSAFEKAFATAKSEGKSTFTFNGKSYNTKTKEDTKDDSKKELSGYEKAFAKARSEGKSSFMYNGKSYATNVKGEKSKQKTMTAFQKAYKAADDAGKYTFMYNGKKYKTSNKKSSSSSSGTVIAPGGACFSAGTLIETSNGQIPIEMIKIDDEVKSYNTKTKEIELAKVDELFVHEDCGDGLILNGSIKTTTNHPFYVDGKWVEAGDLKMGDKILHVDGLTHEITSMEINDDKQTVYNFEVPGHHNYFAEGYLVHNKQRKGGYRRKGGIR